MAERVTGEILLECDDEVLYQELKVTRSRNYMHTLLSNYNDKGRM